MFIRPCEGRITSHFQPSRKNPVTGIVQQHAGVDFGRDGSTRINAAASGTVTRAGVLGGFGNCVMILHKINGRTYETVYAHLRTINVKLNQRVSQGQQIGVKGTTGNSTGVHLHFELHVGGRWNNKNTYAVDPIHYVIDEDVKVLQRLLNQVGVKLNVDGKNGPSTINAIKAFQKSSGLVVDGSAGPLTMAALKDAFAKTNAAATPPKKEETVLPKDDGKNARANSSHIAGQEFVKKHGISNGEYPAKNVTREQVWTMLHRMYDKLKE